MFYHPLFIAAVLVAATVVIHASGFALLLHASRIGIPKTYGGLVWLLIKVAWGLILIHTLEIILWGFFYWWKGCLPGFEASIYFSGITYTTIGYGDLVLDGHWRLLAPIEGLVGILMCGLSAGMFFGLAGRIYAAQKESHSN